MINYIADSIRGASTWAWIYTFSIQARLIIRTVSIEDTFGATASVRIALILWQTCANAIIALRVRSTWGWIASIWRWRRNIALRLWLAISERIAHISLETLAYWIMVVYIANGIKTAGTWTRIGASIAYACLITRAISIDAALWMTVGWRTIVIGLT